MPTKVEAVIDRGEIGLRARQAVEFFDDQHIEGASLRRTQQVCHSLPAMDRGAGARRSEKTETTLKPSRAAFALQSAI